MSRLCIVAAFFLSLSFQCSPPPSTHLAVQSQPSPAVIFNEVFNRRPFRGSGSLLLVATGEKQSGIFDIRYNGATSFDVTFYSPLGTTIGSVVARGDSGILTFSETIVRQSLDQPLDAGLFPWGGNVKLSDALAAMCGIPIERFDPELLTERATSARNCREFVTENKSKGFTVIFDDNLKKLKRIMITGGIDASSHATYSISYKNFLGGMARFITIKTSDRNYFSLRYDTITWVK